MATAGDADFLARVYLKLTWVKVAPTAGELLSLLSKRSSDLGVHTEVLQSRDDTATWILCDYHTAEPENTCLSSDIKFVCFPPFLASQTGGFVAED